MRLWFLALIVAAAAIGCSGGSSSIPDTSPTAPTRFNVAIAVRVPSLLAAAGVRSIVVSYVPVGEAVPPPISPVTIDVAAGSSDCVVSGATAVCSAMLGVPLGLQNFTIALYAGANGTGAQLGVKSFTTTITGAGQVVDISNANGGVGVVAALRLAISPDSIFAGMPSSFNVSVNAYDASGRLITTPYNEPVTIVPPATPAPGLPPLLTAPPVANGSGIQVATGPGQIFKFGYLGTTFGLPAELTFMATAISVPTAAAELIVTQTPTPTPIPTATPTATPTPAPTLPVFATPSPGPVAVQPNVVLFQAPTQPAQTFVASELGVTTFTAVSSNVGVATVTPTGTTFTVTPVAVGFATITVSDATGNTGTVYAYVNQSTVIISGRRRH